MSEEGPDTGGSGAGSHAAPADQPKRCANCGDRIPFKEWHPVVAKTDDDGEFTLFAFCTEDCRKSWQPG
jgi:hypothetical protein